MTTPLAFKALIIIRDRQQAVNSHLIEFCSREECDAAIDRIKAWGGFFEVIRLY